MIVLVITRRVNDNLNAFMLAQVTRCMRHIIRNKDLLSLFDWGLALQLFAMNDRAFAIEKIRNSLDAFMEHVRNMGCIYAQGSKLIVADWTAIVMNSRCCSSLAITTTAAERLPSLVFILLNRSSDIDISLIRGVFWRFGHWHWTDPQNLWA